MSAIRRGADRHCKTCSKLFYVYPSGDKHDAHRYCSYACWLADPDRRSHYRQGERETRTCEKCGKTYERLKSDEKNRRFCSQECAYSSRKGSQHPRYKATNTIKAKCPVCGKPFERPRAWIKDGYRTAYCSRECKGKDMSAFNIGENAPNWRGGHDPYYGPNWLQQRRHARHRDGYTCQRCGKTETELGRHLDVHHVKPFRTFSKDWRAANHVSNLISLCNACHLTTEPRKNGDQPLPPTAVS